MKTLALVLFLTSPFVNASSGTGGVPTVPCYVDGQLKGHIEITQCEKLGGKTTR